MSVNPTPSRPVRRPGKAAFRFRLFLLLLFFCGGFYTGVYATARMATAPAWEQSLFRLLPAARSLPPAAPIAPTPAPTTPPSPAPVAAAHAPAVSTPAPPPASAPTSEPTPASAPNTPAANPPASADTPSAEEATSTPASSQPSHAELADLDRQVKDYNSLLRRIQDTQHTYSAAHQTTLNANAQANEMQSALDRQNTALDELISLVQEAQASYDKIAGSSGYADRYVEKELCLPQDRVPQGLSELSVDKLRFLRRR